MKQILAVMIIALSFGVSAQISFKTGDAGFDAELTVTNKEAKEDINAFKQSLKDTYNATTSKIDEMLKIMEPAEALLSYKIADVANQPIDNVVNSYRKNSDKGWGAIAKEMGIKPGSPEFHALKGKAKKSKGSGNGNGGGNGKGKGKGKK